VLVVDVVGYVMVTGGCPGGDSYLGPIFVRMQLDMELEFNRLSPELDVLSKVYGRIVLDYPYDVNRSLVRMP
jgi:hypothetical protein